MEELEEERNDREYSSQVGGGTSRPKLERRLKLGKQILLAGFVASSAPVVLPSIMVVSAIGFAVSMPCVFFLASQTVTHKLLRKLLPRPTTPSPLFFYSNGEEEKQQEEEEQERQGQSVLFEGDIDMDQGNKDLQEETKREIKMIEDMHNEENRMTLGKGYGHGVLLKNVTERSQDIHVIEDHKPKEDNNDYTVLEEKPPPKKPITDVELEIGESRVEQLTMGDHGVAITFEGLDKVNNDTDEFEKPFEITTVAFEEFGDWAMESDIKGELEKETQRLLEKLRDEGKKNNGVKHVKENDKRICSIVDDVEIGWKDEQKCSIWRIGGEGSKEEDRKANERMLKSRHAENMDPIHDVVESAQLIQCMLEDNDVDHRKSSQKPVAELCGLKNGGSIIYEPVSTELAKDAGAREIADEKIYSKKNACTIEIQGDMLAKSSDTIIQEHADAIEVPVSTAEDKSKQSEYFSGKDVASPSKEVILNEENIWKKIHAMQMIVGYEATPHASCIDELKALYIFTGVEPPSLSNDSSDFAEINDKLHFLMSIVGVKLNAA